MQKTQVEIKAQSAPIDIAILLSVVAIIYGIVLFAEQMQGTFTPNTEIVLDGGKLPLYSFFSAVRGLVAYFISLSFALSVGYWAAKSKSAEKFILPFLDIMQSIPVLGFLPGLVMGLIAIFPRNNVGLEIAAIIMIFTGQVWNMVFSFYASLKAIPQDLRDASLVMRLSNVQKFFRLELPYAAVNLSWNSLMSMAGGWFFLSVCEAFTLGETSFRLPGLGAYMSVAIEAGNMRAILSGILAMMSVILVMDILVWRPVLAWVYKFRLEDLPGAEQEPPFVELLLRDSILFRYALLLRARRPRLRTQRIKWVQVFEKMSGHWHRFVRAVRLPWALVLKVLLGFLVMTLIAAVLRLSVLLKDLTGTEWLEIAYAVLMTGLRVVVCLILASIWTVPLGIWLGQDQKRIRWAQPIVQIAASFPAPMLFPLALGVLFILRIPFGIGSIFLMMIGVQWYILFNVLAGALRISAELQQVANLMNISKIDKWRYLYLPSVFPTLVTGWVNAAGGAWNASIVAEYASYKGERLITTGVGATISKAASEADFPRLAAALLVMVVTLVLINRTVWSRVYRLTSERYRMES